MIKKSIKMAFVICALQLLMYGCATVAQPLGKILDSGFQGLNRANQKIQERNESVQVKNCTVWQDITGVYHTHCF